VSKRGQPKGIKMPYIEVFYIEPMEWDGEPSGGWYWWTCDSHYGKEHGPFLTKKEAIDDSLNSNDSLPVVIPTSKG
jgi:hypothetical protein